MQVTTQQNRTLSAYKACWKWEHFGVTGSMCLLRLLAIARKMGKNPIQVLALSKAMSQMVLPRAEGDQSLDTDPATKGKQSYRGERSGIQVLI